MSHERDSDQPERDATPSHLSGERAVFDNGSGSASTSAGAGHGVAVGAVPARDVVNDAAVSISIIVSVSEASAPGDECVDGSHDEGAPASEAERAATSLAPLSSAARLSNPELELAAPEAASPHSTPLPPRRALPARRRRRRPWLLVALAAAAGMRVCGEVEPSEGGASAARAPAPPPSSGTGALLFANVDGTFDAATFGSAPFASLAPGAAAGKNRLVSEHADALEAAGIPMARGEVEPIRAPESFELTARTVAPGRSWQDAANASDWPAVALLIDMLPEAERGVPGARYARAVAARELGQCDTA